MTDIKNNNNNNNSKRVRQDESKEVIIPSKKPDNSSSSHPPYKRWNKLSTSKIFEHTSDISKFRQWIVKYLQQKQRTRCCVQHWQQNLYNWFNHLFILCIESEHQSEKAVYLFLVFLYSWRFLPTKDIKRRWIQKFFVYFGNRLEDWYFEFQSICLYRKGLQTTDAVEIIRFIHEEFNELKLLSRTYAKITEADDNFVIDFQNRYDVDIEHITQLRLEKYQQYVAYILSHHKFETSLYWLCFLWKLNPHINEFPGWKLCHPDLFEHVPMEILHQLFVSYYKNTGSRNPFAASQIRATSKPFRIGIFDYPNLLSFELRMKILEDFHRQIQHAYTYEDSSNEIFDIMENNHRGPLWFDNEEEEEEEEVEVDDDVENIPNEQEEKHKHENEIKLEPEEKEKEHKANVDELVIECKKALSALINQANRNEDTDVEAEEEENYNENDDNEDFDDYDDYDYDNGEDDDDEHFQVVLDRDNVFSCFLNAMENRRERFMELNVTFVREEIAFDAGGVQREAFRLFMNELFNPSEMNRFWTIDEDTGYALPLIVDPELLKTNSSLYKIWISIWNKIGMVFGIALLNNMWNVAFNSPIPTILFMKLLRNEQVTWVDFVTMFPKRAQFLTKLRNPEQNSELVYPDMPSCWSGSALEIKADYETLDAKNNDKSLIFNLTKWQSFTNKKNIDLPCNENNPDVCLDRNNALQMDAYVSHWWRSFLGLNEYGPWTYLVNGLQTVISQAEAMILHPYEMKQFFDRDHQMQLLKNTNFLKTHFKLHERKLEVELDEKEVVKRKEYFELFWKVIERWDYKQIWDLLLFITSDLDILRKMEHQQAKITVVLIKMDKAWLPNAHTCSNTLDLPFYATEEILEQSLLKCLEYKEGFGLQ